MMRVSIAILIGMLFFIGCSARTGNIVSPDSPMNSNVNLNGNTGLIVESFDEDGNPITGSGFMGIYQGIIDLDAMTAELIPVRNVALDDVLEMVDITYFLNLAPCIDCAKLFGIELDLDSNVVLKIGVKHPFQPGDPFKPITGRNRGDLHVFNVEGTVIFKDENNLSFPAIGAVTDSGYLKNADGYSHYLDPVIDEFFNTTSTVHPYIMHFDDYSVGNFNPELPTGFESVTIPPPSGNLVMPMGSDYDIKDYVFSFESEGISEFIFAIGCTYAVSAANKAQRFNPEFQIPQHNKKAASEVRVEILNNQLEDSDTSSYADLLIKVLDINHGIPIGTGLDEMRADSSVSGIFIDIPGVTSGLVSGTTTPTGGDGRDPSSPLTFPVTVTNESGAPEGIYMGLVKVSDSYQPGMNESPLLNGMDGIKRVDPLLNPLSGLYSINEFATYQIFEIPIEFTAVNTPPVAVMCMDEIFVCSGSRATINASCSYDLEDDNEGIPLMFEYDYSYDGLNFVSDTGPPANDPIHRTLIAFFEPGPYMVAVRVTDSGGLTDITSATIIIDNSPALSSWTSDVTDGSTIQNVRFSHTNRRLLTGDRGRVFGLEGMAQGNGYVYLAFYSEDGEVYFTRSADSGSSWDNPALLASGITRNEGVSIAAVENEVFVIYGEFPERTVTLMKNTNSGEGSWDSYLVAEYPGVERLSNIGIAVDPNNSDNVYAVVVNQPWDHYSYSLVLRNSTGGSGSWTETEFYCNHQGTQGRQLDILVNSDSSVYVAWLANMAISVIRSDDFGENWTSYGANSIFTGAWGGELDMCADPSDPDIIYIIWTSVGYNEDYNPTLRLARSTNRTQSFSVLSNNMVSDQQIHEADNPRQPAITCDHDGNVYVSYTFGRNNNPYEYNVFVRKSCDQGGFFSESVNISITQDGWDVGSELIMSPNGGIVITWLEDGYLDPDSTVNPNGKIVAKHMM